MNPQDPYQAAPLPVQSSIKNPLSVMQTGEQVICEIKRHPIGIFPVFILCGFLLILSLVMAVAAPHFVTVASHNKVLMIGLLIDLVFSALVLAFVYVANKVYWGNSWILTSDSLTQVIQTSLFDKQSSQLSLGNLEDVSSEQDGIFPHMFNYGVIRVETAGERSKFVFMYCPNPNGYAQQILNAREQFEQTRRAPDPQQLYRGQGVYQAPAAPGGYQPAQTPPPTQTPPPYYQNPPDSGININTQ